MTAAEWYALAKEGGAYLAPFLLAALFWMDRERKRLIAENKVKEDRLVGLSERCITVMTEMKERLFFHGERKA